MVRRAFPICLFLTALIFSSQSTPAYPTNETERHQTRIYADYLLAHIEPLPHRVRDASLALGYIPYHNEIVFEGSWPNVQYQDAMDVFKAAIREDRGDSLAYAGLASCQEHLGMFDQAVTSYRTALSLSAKNSDLIRRYRQAQQASQIAHAATAQLPAKQTVLQVAPFRRAGKWLVLSAILDSEIDAATTRWHGYLTLFDQTHHGLRKTWQSAPLRDPRETGFVWLSFAMRDLAGAGEPQVAVYEESLGGSWEPTHLEVFSIKQGRLTKTFGVTSNWQIWIQDLNHDGCYEIGVYHEIGGWMSHAEQPRWMDIYAYKQGTYRLADADFPREYRHWPKALRILLKKYPQDSDIWSHLSEAYTILGERRMARVAYDEAMKN